MAIDLFNDDLGTVANDRLYAAIASFAQTQPSESWRHDYTEKWEDSALKNIAAFANTFGGLLIVGVRKRGGDVICDLPGVDSQDEYKTRIASSIAANISPTPPYDIAECHRPEAPAEKFCVVRVRASKALHLITKKGLPPVYVRNENEARPADAAQLRYLIDREAELRTDRPQKIRERAEQLLNSLVVNQGYANREPDTWFLSPRRPSSTFLRLALIPGDPIALELDAYHEDRFGKLIIETYPRLLDTLRSNVALQSEERSAEFYQYTYYHTNLDYEAKWRMTSSGDVAQANQMVLRPTEAPAVWSAVDLALYTVLFVKLVMAWWQTIRYFGEGYLYACVQPGTQLSRDQSGNFLHGFDPQYEAAKRPEPPILRFAPILVSGTPRGSASANTSVDYFVGTRSPARIAASLLNALLRSLGHRVSVGSLQEDIELLLKR